MFERDLHFITYVFLPCRVTGNIVALKEIRLNSAEGTPFTAIREGREMLCSISNMETV